MPPALYAMSGIYACIQHRERPRYASRSLALYAIPRNNGGDVGRVYMHTNIHTYIHTYIYIYIYIHIYIYICITYIRTYIQIVIYIVMYI
jgi:hypothetical protein